MANVLLGATGSVAAVRVPLLYESLTAAGHAVKVVVTDAAAYFFDPAAVGTTIIRDSHEWPHERYQRGDSVTHIELRRWADLFLIAPLDANTLAKLALGLCDNCLTCVWRAWDGTRPVVLAPAMNTLMWENPFTRKHLHALGGSDLPDHLDSLQLIAAINERSRGIRIVPPIEKELACGDVGLGGMAEVSTIIAAVQAMLTRPVSKG